MEEINKEEKTEPKKGRIGKGRRNKQESDKISFDAYFRKLMTKNISVRPHHKAPMKDFVLMMSSGDATSEEFDKILKKY